MRGSTPAAESGGAAQLWRIGIRAYFCGGDKTLGLTPLQDVLYTLYTYAGITNEPAELTPDQEWELARLVADENLARQQKTAERKARKLARALAPPPAKTPRKLAKPV